jgi:ABC transport system ATP-binding/permease protein
LASNTCKHCGGILNRPDARFCSSCGNDLATPAIPASERPTLIGARPASAAAATVAIGARLLVSAQEQQQEYRLADQPLRLGRAADNDIVLLPRFVSSYHARIDPQEAGHCIVDVGSTNGLLFAGQRVARHCFADGDVLRIGDAASGNFVSLTYHNPALQAEQPAASASRSYPLDPQDTRISIGRSGCAIMLDNPQVSRFHAQIERRPDGGHLLRDAGSTNGTFVDGRRIAQHRLQAGDIIQIGPFKLVYNVGSLDEYDQRGSLRIDAVGLSRWVGKGRRARAIINDISLSIAPREFVALVGGSGAGKSTLLKALSGSAPAGSGRLMVNGDDFYVNFAAYRALLGYVPQDDIIHRLLPVNRALRYAAGLRLPADTARSEVAQRIDRVLADVDMSEHQHTMVEQLSGGQRKRVSIGVELLADPSLFFLDEPTSGLDPGLEKKLMYTLRRLADSGRTIVLVTHATANITQCDHVAFLAQGRLVYFGPPNEAPGFFGVSSGDFADIYTRLEGPAEAQDPLVQRELAAELAVWQAGEQSGRIPLLAELWEQKYRASAQYRRYIGERLARLPATPASVAGNGKQRRRPAISALRQFWILSRRAVDLQQQDQRNLLILLLQAPLIALLLLLVAHSDALGGVLDAGLLPRSEAKKVLFMLTTVSVWFGIINAAREIAREQPVYRRERMVNLRIGPYLFSKIVVLSILLLIQSSILLGIVAWGIPLPIDTGVLAGPLLEVFVTMGLTALAGSALGLLISAWASSPDRAVSIVPLALIPQIVFAGLIFSIEGSAEPLSWLTISRWSMEALGVSIDLNGLCHLPNPADGSVAPACAPGLISIEAAYTHSRGHLLSRWACLLLYALACLGLAGWILWRRDRTQRVP